MTAKGRQDQGGYHKESARQRLGRVYGTDDAVRTVTER